MNFIHTTYIPGETIAAIATPPGEGGIAVIRLSGKESMEIASKAFSGPVRRFASHTAHFGTIVDADQKVVDEVLLLVMKAPRSYTGEDTVEVHCHGGNLVTRRVLDVLLQAGARQALPGEFTLRAFLNGRLDLAQAEAVQTLIAAKSSRALEAATKQLQGSLSSKVFSLQKELNDVAAILEAWVDFPEEGLEFSSPQEVFQTMTATLKSLQHLIATYDNGRLLQCGATVCLTGCPNVGKSSLLNALLDKERAIVSPIPGTTRDLIEDHISWQGLHLTLVDTAGIRESDEWVEQEGVRRSQKAIEEGDLILLILDASRGIREEERFLLDQLSKKKTIVVCNKSDLCGDKHFDVPWPHVVYVSAKTRQGLEELLALIDRILGLEGWQGKEEVVVSNVRHKEALTEAAEACQRVVEGLQSNVSPEFLCLDMRIALQALGKIVGANITEDILSAIFSKFCIGK